MQDPAESSLALGCRIPSKSDFKARSEAYDGRTGAHRAEDKGPLVSSYVRHLYAASLTSSPEPFMPGIACWLDTGIELATGWYAG